MRIFSILCLLCFPLLLWAQGDIGLHFLPETFQSSYTNPAYTQSVKFQVCLPAVAPQVYHSGFTIENLKQANLSLNAEGYDPATLINSLDTTEHLLVNAWVMPFAVAFRIRDLQISLHTRYQAYTYIGYPRGLLALGWQGNAAYIGEDLEIGPDVEMLAYRETGARISFPLGDKVRAGLRFNYLGGLLNVSTDRHYANLYTDADYYQLTATTDYRMRAATSLSLNLDSLIEARTVDYDFSAGELFAFGPNRGYSVDMGLSYRPNTQWQADLSIINLGSITWRETSRAYSSQGTSTFAGIDPQAFGWNPSNDSSLFDAAARGISQTVDSLEANIGFTREDTTYRTALPTRFYLSGRYRPLSWVTLGLAWHGQGYRSQFNHQLSGFAGVQLQRWLTFGATYTYHFDYGSLLGVHLRLNGGPVQLFASVGNVVSLFQPANAQSAAVSAGLNVTIGRVVEDVEGD